VSDGGEGGRCGEFAFYDRLSVSGRFASRSRFRARKRNTRVTKKKKKKSLKAACGSTDREPPRGGLNRRFFPFQKDRPNRGARKASFLAGEPPL
jgi:hypothetical protein